MRQAQTSSKFLSDTQRHIKHTFQYGRRTFLIQNQVFSPAYFGTTKIFTNWLTKKKLGSFLEIGCGAGVTLCEAVVSGSAVQALGVDVNPFAVKNTCLNIKRHGLQNKVSSYESDIFSNIPKNRSFDTIYWNTPFINSRFMKSRNRLLERSLFDPGYKLHNRFIREAREYLNLRGRLFIGFGDFGDVLMLKRLLAEHGWKILSIQWKVSDEYGRVVFQLYECALMEGTA